MIKTSIGSATILGNKTMEYVEGETYSMLAEWQQGIANTFIQQGWAEEINKTEKKVVAPTEVKRARNDDGTLKADDESTPDVNEAWEGGKAPMTAKQKRIAAKKALLGRK